MKKAKRILSLIIVLTMCFSLLPTSAFASVSLTTLQQQTPDYIQIEKFLWPVKGRGVNAYYGDPLYSYGNHLGIDLAGNRSDSFRAALSGTVVAVYRGCNNDTGNMSCSGKGCNPTVNGVSNTKDNYNNCCNLGYGNGVVLYHGKDSDGNYYYTQYAHMSEVNPSIEYGMHVDRGQPLGNLGSTGYSSGIHGHFQITRKSPSDEKKNPGRYGLNSGAMNCNPVGNPRGPDGTIEYEMEADPTPDAEDVVITAYDPTGVTFNNANVSAFIHYGDNKNPVEWGIDITDSMVEDFVNIPLKKNTVIDSSSGTGEMVSVNFATDSYQNPIQGPKIYFYRFWVKYGVNEFVHSSIRQLNAPKNAPSFTATTATPKEGGSANDVKISSKIEWTADALPIDWGVDLQNANGDWKNVGVNFSNKISATGAGNINVSLNFANETTQANMLQAGTTYNYRLWVQYRDTINNTTDFHHSPVGTFKTSGTASSETTYPLVFNSNGGSACNTLNVTLGQDYSIPVSTKSGYALSGWTAKRTVGNTETWHVAGKGWYTEAQITSSGYVKEVYTPSRTPTFNTGWTGGNTNATFTFYAVWKENVTSVAVTGVSLNKSSLSLTAGKSEKLTATVSPSNATNKNVTWSSSNSAVAAVASDGTVTAVKAGTATITAKTADGNKTASCTVTVTAPSITVTLEKYSDSYPMSTNTTATVRHKLKVSGISVNDLKKAGNGVGCELYNSTGSTFLGRAQDISTASATITVNSGGYVDTFYAIGNGKELNYALSPGTTYKYRFYAVYSGVRYYSAFQSFTTTGSSPTVAKTLTYNGHTYERYDSSITWTEAKTFCEAQGGHLVTITAEAEQNKVKELLSGCTKNYYWIGASDAASEGTWTWVTGEAFWTGGMNGNVRSGFVAYWDTDAPEPNDRDGENYAGIMGKNVGTRKQIGEWIDVYNGGDTGNDDYALSKSGFICEYEPQKPDTPTVTTDKSSYTQGENVTISWTTAARNENYVLSIYKDGASLYSGSHGQSTTYTLSKPAVGSYEVLVTANNTGGASGQARCTFTVEPVKYRLDLNAVLDGEKNTSLGGYGVVDVYINGQLVQSSCSDYSTSWPAGTSYEFKNIRPADGRSYDGLSTQAGEGISSSARAGSVNDYRDVRLVFHTCPDGIDETPVTAVYNGHSYRFFSTPVTWYDAKHLCEAMGGHLATVTSAEENTFLNTLANGESYWLGGTDRDHEGVWTWITGEAFTYSDWNEYQPDNAKSAAEGSENYLHHLSSMGHWNDNYGSGTYPFVCEYDFVLSYPVVYDANGGTVAPTDQSKPHGTALTLTSDVPTRASVNVGNYTVTLDPNGGSVNSETLTAACTMSYRFKNWNDKADGSGTSYAPGESYTLNEALVLYAQWEKGESVAAVMLPTPMREGYDFVGWVAIDEGMTGVTDSYTPSDDVTLYAVWAKPDFVMPAFLTIIESEAFTGGAFTYVKLPENAVSIGWHAFAECSNLAYIYIPALTTQIDEEAFGNLKDLTIIGKTGSTAETYARNHSFNFIAVP